MLQLTIKIQINDLLNVINNAKNGEADTDKITTLKLISEAMLDKKILYLDEGCFGINMKDGFILLKDCDQNALSKILE